MRLILLPLLLCGCTLAQTLPSLRYCDQVNYAREGREITITAHCFEAVEPAFAVPVPKPL